MKYVFIILGVAVAIFFYFRLKNGTPVSREVAEKRIMQDWGGWVELADADLKPLMVGRITRLHKDDIYFGYGYLVTENLSADFLKDLKSLNPLIEADGRILVKFGVDAQTDNVLSELKAGDPIREKLQKLKKEDAPATTGVWMTSAEFGLPQKPEENANFEKLWSEAILK